MAAKSINILETDVNNKILWAWSFPASSSLQRNFVLQKYVDLDKDESFACCRLKENVCYIFSAAVFESDIALPMVKQCAIVIWSSEYNTEKYEIFCRVLCKSYCKTGDPGIVLQLYLSVMTTGTCKTEENGLFKIQDFESSAAKSDNHHLIDLINMFGLESILIYTALLLKKRIFVYGHKLRSVLDTVKTLPLLIPHRDMRNTLYPWVHLSGEEVNDLKNHSGYIAGTKDSTINTRPELFDILVNISAREVTLPPASRDVFTMTKTHKDIALHLVQMAEYNDTDISAGIAKKTQDLLAHLRSLATTETPDGAKWISIETLRKRQFPPPLENFLFNLAVAENLMLF